MIAEQLQNCKPIWEDKLSELQSLLPTIVSSSLSFSETQVDSSNKPEKRTIFYGYSFRFRRRSYNVVGH